MKCLICGKELQDNEKQCSICGANISQMTPQNQHLSYELESQKNQHINWICSQDCCFENKNRFFYKTDCIKSKNINDKLDTIYISRGDIYLKSRQVTRKLLLPQLDSKGNAATSSVNILVK